MANTDLEESTHLADAKKAFDAGNFPLLYSIIESHQFSDGSRRNELQRLWLDAHYLEAERFLGYPLVAMDRFRVRRMFPPPGTIWDGEQRLPYFEERTKSKLREWYLKDRYPDPEQRLGLALATGLPLGQVTSWFQSERRRDKLANLNAAPMRQVVASPPPQRVQSSLEHQDQQQHHRRPPQSLTTIVSVQNITTTIAVSLSKCKKPGRLFGSK